MYSSNNEQYETNEYEIVIKFLRGNSVFDRSCSELSTSGRYKIENTILDYLKGQQNRKIEVINTVRKDESLENETHIFIYCRNTQINSIYNNLLRLILRYLEYIEVSIGELIVM